MNDLIKEIAAEVDKLIAEKTEYLPFSRDQGFLPIKIDESRFHQLGMFSQGQLWAIDGGNCSLVRSPGLCVDFIRVCGCYYEEKKRKKVIKKEFFVITRAETEPPRYVCELIGDYRERIYIDAVQDKISEVEIESIAGIIRRMQELRLCDEVMNAARVIVMDGSMEFRLEEEFNLINDIKKKAILKGVLVGFLSKTSRMLTKDAHSLNSTLNELGPKSSWYYHPVFKITNFPGDICFVKLNSKSQYVFRLDFFEDIRRLASELASNSDDPVFLGYPFCLIEADRIARVGNQEKEYLKTVFMNKIRNRSKLSYLLANMDAHDKLDSIS